MPFRCLQANAQQRCEEQRDIIVNLLKEQIIDIVQWLEAVLHHIKRSIYMPGSKTIQNNKLCNANIDHSGKAINVYQLTIKFATPATR